MPTSASSSCIKLRCRVLDYMLAPTSSKTACLDICVRTVCTTGLFLKINVGAFFQRCPGYDSVNEIYDNARHTAPELPPHRRRLSTDIVRAVSHSRPDERSQPFRSRSRARLRKFIETGRWWVTGEAMHGHFDHVYPPTHLKDGRRQVRREVYSLTLTGVRTRTHPHPLPAVRLTSTRSRSASLRVRLLASSPRYGTCTGPHILRTGSIDQQTTPNMGSPG